MRISKTRPRAEPPARERILDAAIKLFTKKPFDEISTPDIAKEAGVAHGLTFHYFGSKERLYEEVSQIVANKLDQIHSAGTKIGTPDQRIRKFLKVHMKEVYRRRVDYVFHSRGGASPKVQAIWEASRHNAIAMVLGFYGVTNHSSELEVAVRAWLGYFDELVLAWLQGSIRDERAVVEMTMEIFPQAIRNAKFLGAKDAPEIPY